MNFPTDLQDIYKEGRLSLFVGAGISKSCNLPDWEKLCHIIIENAWDDSWGSVKDFVKTKSPLDSMRIVRDRLGSNFEDIVYKCLYQNKITYSETIKAISELVNIKHICSYNYDDLLEHSLAFNNRKFRVSTKNNTFDPDKYADIDTVIYHPHGFIPQSSYNESDDAIKNYTSELLS